MTGDRLVRECHSFAWARVGDVPTDDVIEAYRRAHAEAPLDVRPAGIDAVLIRVGASHPWLARFADAYAALFVRRGLFRTKLVVLLAMLESGAPHHWRFEPPERSRTGSWARLIWWGLGAGLKALVAILAFGPVHAAAAIAGRGDSARERSG
ncbi:MAG: hypothetical protein R3266_07710 [Gemmatimonadota bacterium]|nr:hypothetical protein [Gemmatimonadota bacterium]